MGKRSARDAVGRAIHFPYDAGAAFWNDKTQKVPPPKDAAHLAARAVLADLLDRRGVKHVLEELNHPTRKSLTADLAEIIRETYRQETPNV